MVDKLACGVRIQRTREQVTLCLVAVHGAENKLVTLDGQLLGFEALIRWTHPTRGFVSPASFIPLAEETGAIVPIGEWVIHTALAQLRAWQALPGCSDLTMNVNVSPRQLHSDQLLPCVEAALAQNDLVPGSVIIEITESGVVDDPTSNRTIEQLSQLGVGIAADDFGTGFANYAALAQLPYTIVKLDRSLISGLTGHGNSTWAQVKSIIEMAHGMDLQVVAEGIEDEAQQLILRAMNCDKAQGYLFSRPLDANAASQFVNQAIPATKS